MDSTTIFATLFFSCVGIGFFSYGKKNNIYFLISGLVLMIFPYFVSSVIWLLIFGIAIILLPFLLNWLNPL